MPPPSHSASPSPPGEPDPTAAAGADDSPAAGLLARRIVFVLGKGGVGRSTIAAALGLLASRRGLRAIVVEVSGRGDVPRLFERACEDGVETELAPGLFTLSVEPRLALEEYLKDQLPGRLIAEMIGASGAAGYVAAATPGLRELLTVGKIWELAQDQRRPAGALPYDVVIVDAPATGHGLALLEAPRTFAKAAQIGPIARQGAIIAETLRDRRQTAMAAVATPEQAAVDELLELSAQLGGELDAVIANAVTPRRYSEDDARTLREAHEGAQPGRPLRAALAVALAEEALCREQREQVARLPAPTLLPRMTAPELSVAELGTLADELAAVA
jgi:anion-transporting  ArsA/GET3 family ATPase